MPKALFDITADIGRESRVPSVTAKQFDKSSRFLRVHIVNHGRPVHVAQDSTVTINAKRSDGEANAFSGTVNPDGSVTVPLTNWALAAAGTLRCDISIIGSDSTKLTTTAFSVEVEGSTYSGSDISEDSPVSDVLTEVLTEINNRMPKYEIGPGLAVSENTLYVTVGSGGGGEGAAVDPTLSFEGFAADAKATGEAITRLVESGSLLESRVADLEGYAAADIAVTDYSKYAYDVFTEDELNPEEPVDPEIPLKLTNSWDFTSGSLTDSIAGFTAVNTGCTLDSSGLTVGKADARCALGYGLITAGSAIEIDVSSAQAGMAAGKHGRCFMFYDKPEASGIASGLVYRHQTGSWAFYFGGWGNDLSSDKDLFNGKTIRLELDNSGYFSLYADGELIGKSNVSWPSAMTGFAIGGYADSFYSLTVSAVRVYRREQ